MRRLIEWTTYLTCIAYGIAGHGWWLTALVFGLAVAGYKVTGWLSHHHREELRRIARERLEREGYDPTPEAVELHVIRSVGVIEP